MRLGSSALILLACCLLLGSSPRPAFGAEFFVTATTDAVDANPGDGVCASATGECTLRAAIQETNALPGVDTVLLGANTYILAIAGRNEETSATGDLDILDDLTVIGERACPILPPGSTSGKRCVPASTIDGGGLDRVLSVHESAAVDMSYVAIQNGVAINADAGGGIANVGKLSLTDVSLAGNTSSGAAGGLFNRYGESKLVGVTVTGNEAGSGGGIENFESGSIEISESLVSGNLSDYGAGISNWGAGSIKVTSSTVAGNAALLEGGGISNIGTGSISVQNGTISVNTAPLGAALINAILPIAEIGPGFKLAGQALDEATSDIRSSTIAANSASSGSGISNDSGRKGVSPGVVTVVNSIIGGLSQANNCIGQVTSLGHNIDSTHTCGFTASGDLSGADPLLVSLTDNGGAAVTHALLQESPAVDAADDAACPTDDQRGVARPIDGDGDGIAVCDIGAVEAFGQLPATPTPAPSPIPTPKTLPESGGGPSPAAGPGAAALAATGLAALFGGAALVASRTRRRIR